MEERNKRIKNKATKCTVIVDVIILVTFLLDWFIHPSSSNTMQIIALVVIILLMIFITLLVFKASLVAFDFDEKEKESRQFAESVLSSQEYTEVIPIKVSEHEEFICGLTDIAKFYAIINEDNKVKISVKFNNEKEFRPLESFSKVYFKEYYKLSDSTQDQQTES